MQSTVRRQHRPRAVRTLLLPSRVLGDSLFLCTRPLVHAACRTSALNQNHVALVALLRSCVRTIAASHDTRLRRSHVSQWGLCPLTQNIAPILRECSILRLHRSGTRIFRGPAGLRRDGGYSCAQLLTAAFANGDTAGPAPKNQDVCTLAFDAGKCPKPIAYITCM
jgi:hypothetical protein